MTMRPERQPRHQPTTTHAERGAGDPHLRISHGPDRSVFHLTDDVVRIGSGGDCAIRVSGAEGLHAEIVHDDRDEYVLTLHGEGETSANPEAAGTHPDDRSQTLRTGASFTVGDWRFVFQREEYADHGRPFGGREGGELSDQPEQPPREELGSASPDHDGSSEPQD